MDAHIPNMQMISKIINTEKPSALLLKLLAHASTGLLKTVPKQLSDFLEGGQFSTQAEEKDLSRTNYARVTNLGCEHHFGDLDSSQNASMHHHSSVQLLK